MSSEQRWLIFCFTLKVQNMVYECLTHLGTKFNWQTVQSVIRLNQLVANSWPLYLNKKQHSYINQYDQMPKNVFASLSDVKSQPPKHPCKTVRTGMSQRSRLPSHAIRDEGVDETNSSPCHDLSMYITLKIKQRHVHQISTSQSYITCLDHCRIEPVQQSCRLQGPECVIDQNFRWLELARHRSGNCNLKVSWKLPVLGRSRYWCHWTLDDK